MSSSPPPTATEELRDPALWAVALTVLAIQMLWTTYERYVPGFLSGPFALPAVAITLVLTSDNLLGLLLEPLVGLLGDRAKTLVQRRLPWLLAVPVAVAAFVMLPWPPFQTPAAFTPMALLIAVMLVTMSLFRTPVVSLMPELVASSGRSAASGLLQSALALGALGVLLMGDGLVARAGPSAPFILSSVVMLAALALLVFLIRRVPEPAAPPAHDRVVSRGETLRLMATIALWWLGFVVLRAFLGDNAARWSLDGGSAEEWIMIGLAVSAVPMGFLAGDWGRRRTVAVSSLLAAVAIGLLVTLALPRTVAITLLIAAGIGWGGITVNALAMLLDHGAESQVGLRTGMYFASFALAGLVGPWLVRLVRPTLGAGGLWLTPLLWAAALVVLKGLPPQAGEVEAAGRGLPTA